MNFFNYCTYMKKSTRIPKKVCGGGGSEGINPAAPLTPAATISDYAGFYTQLAKSLRV